MAVAVSSCVENDGGEMFSKSDATNAKERPTPREDEKTKNHLLLRNFSRTLLNIRQGRCLYLYAFFDSCGSRMTTSICDICSISSLVKRRKRAGEAHIQPTID
eukprot:scaffold5992_cov78-Skeletonema_marinoi.AAC.6